MDHKHENINILGHYILNNLHTLGVSRASSKEMLTAWLPHDVRDIHISVPQNPAWASHLDLLAKDPP